ncbi:uncharacterized protein I303_103494 [Kwoniella dejecticola CBS 10117]|uniref:TLC domain-containing protein n=1 Tax=Kwoniella dejecticola CBS 10117 TaxID=1296121 RepID=A0AAJ8KNH8_9TREE
MFIPLLCGVIYALFYLTYALVSPKFDSERKKAYILSVISSFTMTVLSIPFFISYLRYGLEKTFKDGQAGWMGEMGRFSTVFFGLTIGYFKYRSQVGLLTGWIHHTVYIGLMFYVAHAKIAPIFLTGAIMELPTFDLGMSNLFPSLRNNIRFLSSFFIFRILYHVIYLVDVARPHSRSYMGGSWVPTIMLGLALMMHVSWFKGGLTGYIKRQSKSKSRSDAKIDLRSKQTSQVEIDTKQDLLIEAVSGYDENIKDGLLPSSPDDSPLVTPRTPSSGPFLHLSNIQIPNLNLNLNMNMPTLPSLTELTAALNKEKLVESGQGFKEAVKHRWDEQKEKFNTRGQLLYKRNKLDRRDSEEIVVVREVVME